MQNIEGIGWDPQRNRYRSASARTRPSAEGTARPGNMDTAATIAITDVRGLVCVDSLVDCIGHL